MPQFPTGRFRIEVSKTASLVDYDDLSVQEKSDLESDANFDPSRHDLFRFEVSPIILPSMTGKEVSGRNKKFCYSKTDVINVDLGPDEDFTVHGVYPLTSRAEDTPWLRDGKLDIKIGYKRAYLRIAGKLTGRHDEHMIHVKKTDAEAQWFFLKPFIANGTQIRITVLGAIGKKLKANARMVSCSVYAKQGNRTIESARNKRIFIPSRTTQPAAQVS